eukprot:scaffold128860_cov32-Attheya_sp.AAC.1
MEKKDRSKLLTFPALRVKGCVLVNYCEASYWLLVKGCCSNGWIMKLMVEVTVTNMNTSVV